MLHSLIGVSLAIHLVIFMHIAGIYHSHALSFIELTLEDISKPFSRDIPRPRLRPKSIEKPRKIKKLEVPKRVVPRFKPIKIDDVNKDFSSGVTESISVSDLLNDSGLDLAGWNPRSMKGLKEILSQKDYYDIVRLRIESHKEYPQMAKMKRIEGRTTVEFVIGLDGSISGLRVVTSSRNKSLDKAAISTVKKASPFPKPPLNFFKGPIPIEITIVFEIT